MIRTRRNRRVTTRSSLEDDRSQSRSQFKSYHTRSSSMVQSNPQQAQRCNNKGNKLIPPSDPRFQLKNSSGDTSSSESEDEEYIHMSRLRLLRNHSDYETGESSDRNLRSGRGGVALKAQRNPEPSTLQQYLDTDPSSSDDSVLNPLKNLKRQLSPSSSETSDSGVPIASRRSVKRRRVFSSSEESCSEISSAETADETLNHNLSNNSVEKDTATGSQLARISTQENRGISVAVPSSSIRNLRGRMIPVEESESEGDLVSTNHTIRGRRIPVIESEDNIDSPEEYSTRRSPRVSSVQVATQRVSSESNSNNIRRRSRRNIQNSVGNIWRVTTQSEEPEDIVIPQSNLRRVSGRRIPVIVSEDDSESDTGNGGNDAVHRISSEVSNLARGSVPSNQRNLRVHNDLGRRNIIINQSEDEFNSSDSDIRPRTLSNRIMPIFRSDDSSSSSSSTDSDDSIPIRNPRRRSRPIPIVDDIENIADHKVQNENSSDTDGEAEKCPICLTGFKLQEIGKPKSCDHNFCSSCIKEWATKNNTCPVDRKLFDGIIVYDKIEGKTIREIPVEMANPQYNFEVDFGSIEDIVAELFTDSDAESSWYFDDSDGDGPEELCSVCGSDNQPHRMISCDLCYSVCHLSCLNPPLRDFPSFGWLCSYCEQYDADSD